MLILPRQVDGSINNSNPLYLYTLVALLVIVGGIGTLFFHNQDSLFEGYKLTAAAGDSGSNVTYYVSTTGSDTNNGTSIDAPFKTVQKAADLAVAGDTVLIREGTYRERVDPRNAGTSNNMITFSAYQNEKVVIKATDIVTGWTTYQGNIWKKDNWGYDSQQVFVDFDAHPGPPLEQIGNPSFPQYSEFMGRFTKYRTIADMTAGSFYYDKTSGSLYVWLADGSDPNNHVMDVGKRAGGFYGKGYTHIKGITFRFGNTGIVNYFPIVTAGGGGVIDRCDIQWGDEGGAFISSGGKLINSVVSNNGNNGVGAQGSNNVISGNTIQYNNYRNYETSHLGGLKLIPDFGGVIENNNISYNKGIGLWIDTNYTPGQNTGPLVTIRYNVFRENSRDFPKPISNNKDGLGIFFEISQNTHIHDNLFFGDNVRGIYISVSRDAKIFNNTMIGNLSYNTIDISNAPLTVPHMLINNSVRNNIVSQPSGNNNVLLLVNGYAAESKAHDNTSDFNLFWPSVRISANSSEQYGTTKWTIPAWTAFGGQDAHSISLDPKLTSPSPSSPSDTKLQWNSPAIDAGTEISFITRTRDYFGNPIYGIPDIGAVEYQPPYDIRSNSPDVGANVRVYADGKFRNKSSPSGTVAKIKFSPAGGYPSNTYSQWIDLTIRSSKDFDITSSDIGIPGNIISTGDLTPNSYYAVSVDSVQGTGVTGTGYASGVAKADSNGTITWRYDGTYAKHTFTIAETTTTPVPVNEILVAVDTAATQRPPRIPRVALQPQPVDPNAPAPVNYSDTQDILNSEAPVGADVVLANLSKWTYVLPDSFLFTRSLEFNDTGDDVRALQYILARENNLDPSTFITGEYDAATATELEKVQKRFGIVVSRIEKVSGYGVLGTRTWTKFNQAIYRGRWRLKKTATAPVTTATAVAVVTPTVQVGTPFTTPLRLGMTHTDVKRLQVYLNQKGFTVAKTGNGSVGKETTYFGPATRAALIKFQEFYKGEILTPVGLTKGSGYFGSSTMRKVNKG